MHNMQTQGIEINAILRGKVKNYDHYNSAIAKQPVDGEVLLSTEGLNGDEQADRRVHGGPDKALHHYPFEHYAYWQKKLTACPHERLQTPGAFGENICTTGMTEENLCFGDQFNLGDDAIIQISQTRLPCWKLNHRFNTPNMSLYVQESGKTGWYYRVLQEGCFNRQSKIKLMDRPYPQWPLNRINQVMFATQVNQALFEAFLELPITASWRSTIEKRLTTHSIESMNRRLYGTIE